MPNRYTRSKKTKDDIKQITHRSMLDFGEKQTRKYMSGLQDAFQLLADTPETGSLLDRPGLAGKRYRYHRYVSHVIFYKQRQNDIFIVRVLHTRMLPENHL